MIASRFAVRLAVVVVSAFTLAACGDSAALLPDGGKVELGCKKVTATLAVKVIDANGVPVSGAQVVGTKLDTGVSATYATDSSGVTTGFTDAVGPGVLRLTASQGGRTSMVFDTNWTCSGCSCYVQPDFATLMVQ